MDDMLLLDFFVAGKPEPQGSTRAFVPTDKKGRPLRRPDGSIVVNLTSDNPKLKSWRAAIVKVAEHAVLLAGIGQLRDMAIAVEVDFHLPRPEGHWRTGRNAHLLRESAPAAPQVRPDVDKLLRATLDGLSGCVYADDGQVTAAAAEEHYAVPTAESDGVGARIRVFRRGVQQASDLPEAARERWVGRPLEPVDESQLALV